MLSFFRRALSSWFILGLLGLVMIAFIVTGVSGPQTPGSTGKGDTIVTLGRTKLRSSEIEQHVQAAYQQARQQDPTVTMASFLAQGGLDGAINDYVSSKAIEYWGRREGLYASDKMIDGEIASIPAFFGATGRFDPQVMRGMLAQQKISEQQLRDDVGGSAIRRQLLIPVAGASKAPTNMVLPYSSLLLEQRSGLVGIVPTAAIPPGPPPTDAEVQAFYRQNIARFTIPERRALRYATFGTGNLTGSFAPTDAEVQAFYDANRATYAGSESRSFSQVVLPSQAAATAFAAKVRGGTAFAAAAQQAGFGAADIAVADVSKAALTTRASGAVADAAFAAAQGAIVGPVKSDFGWHVLKVDAVRTIAARPLAAVRAEIVESVTKQKRDEALASQVAAIQNDLDNGSSFDEVVRVHRLTAATTPALLPNGSAPDDAGYRAPPEMTLLLRSAQDMDADTDPTIQTLGAGQNYALLSVSRVVPAAPAALDKIRPAVAEAIVTKRRADRAQQIARAIEAKAKRGMPLEQAIREAGIPLPPPRPAQARQIDLARLAQGQGQQVPRPLALLFAMRQGDTKLIPAEQGAGWFVVSLQRVVPGDARSVPGLIESTRSEFTRVLGDEYAQQFSNAVTRELGVKRDEAAIARLRTQLGNSGGGGQ